MPKPDLLVAVREAIEDDSKVNFQNKSGDPVENFLDLLKFYLRFIYLEFQGQTYIQREGICIGLAVGPVHSDILLRRCDRALERTPSGKGIIN